MGRFPGTNLTCERCRERSCSYSLAAQAAICEFCECIAVQQLLADQAAYYARRSAELSRWAITLALIGSLLALVAAYL